MIIHIQTILLSRMVRAASTALVLLIFASCAEAPARYGFHTEHDDFDKQYSFVMDTQPMRVDKASDSYEALGFHLKKVLTPDNATSLVLDYDGHMPIGLSKDEKNFVILVDEKRFELNYAGGGKRHVQAFGRFINVESKIPFTLGPDLIKALHGAKNVRFRIDGANIQIEGHLDDQVIANLVKFLDEAGPKK